MQQNPSRALSSRPSIDLCSIVWYTVTRGLDNRTATLFLIAGVLFVIAAVNNSLVFVTEGYEPGMLSSLLLLIGLVVALIGLGGMYSSLRERTPRLARGSLAVIGLAGIALVVLLLWALGNAAGLLSEVPPPIALATLALLILGFALFGATVLRTTIYPQLVGFLLLAEAVALLMVFTVPIFVYGGEPPRAFGPGIEGVQALFLLGISYVLRQAETGVDQRERAPDTTV